MSPSKTLSAVSTWGATLTVVILAMTVLLRLGTRIEDGAAISTLPQDLEQWARVVHRIAAGAVGILAALALVAVWRGEAPPRPNARAAWTVVALTLALAVVGRYSPGYRIDLVTVVNVAGGVSLAAAFRALRPAEAAARDPVALAALLLLIALAALGAAADAAAMRGTRAFGPLHLWIATIFGCLALSAAWRRRERPLAASATALLTLAQFGLGFALLAGSAPRPLVLGWLHAMTACGLALLLAGLGFGRGRREHPV